MAELLACLQQYRPTKIALEVSKDQQTELNESYQDYIAGNLELSRNEKHQIGFQLGKKLRHTNIYAVDWNEEVQGIPDLEEWVSENPSTVLEHAMKDMEEEIAAYEAYLRNHSIREYILMLQQPKNSKRNHESYMKVALVGDTTNHVGAMWVTNYWYYRDMIIYKNMVELIENPEEKMFVLYGLGHLHLLKQFLQENSDFRLENPANYL